MAAVAAPAPPPANIARKPEAAAELKPESKPEAKPKPDAEPATLPPPAEVAARSESLKPAAPVPAPKPAPARRPAAPVDPLANPPLSESERLALAAIPLPKLPTLISREAAAARDAAAAAAAAPAPEPLPAAAPTEAAAEPDQAWASDEELAALLKRANERAGLGDAELARIAAVEQKVAAGERAAALEALARLNTDLDREVRIYSVAKGENLRAVAARPENYGNAALWPLIWRANIEALPEPWQVQRNQKLIVPSYPPLSDVTEALRYAQEHQQDVVRPEAR